MAGLAYASHDLEANIMRWPWQRIETRAAVGRIHRNNLPADRGASGRDDATGVRHGSGRKRPPGLAVSRSLSSAIVEAPGELAEAVLPRVLAQVGRDLVQRRGIVARDSLHGRPADADSMFDLVF